MKKNARRNEMNRTVMRVVLCVDLYPFVYFEFWEIRLQWATILKIPTATEHKHKNSHATVFQWNYFWAWKNCFFLILINFLYLPVSFTLLFVVTELKWMTQFIEKKIWFVFSHKTELGKFWRKKLKKSFGYCSVRMFTV